MWFWPAGMLNRATCKTQMSIKNKKNPEKTKPQMRLIHKGIQTITHSVKKYPKIETFELRLSWLLPHI